jgi:hypothetical protein
MARLVPVKIAIVEGHEDPSGGQLNRGRGIDAKALATPVPVENDLSVGDPDPAIHQIAVSPLVEPKSIGGYFYKMLVAAPGAQIDEVFFIQALLTGGQ